MRGSGWQTQAHTGAGMPAATPSSRMRRTACRSPHIRMARALDSSLRPQSTHSRPRTSLPSMRRTAIEPPSREAVDQQLQKIAREHTESASTSVSAYRIKGTLRVAKKTTKLHTRTARHCAGARRTRRRAAKMILRSKHRWRQRNTHSNLRQQPCSTTEPGKKRRLGKHDLQKGAANRIRQDFTRCNGWC